MSYEESVNYGGGVGYEGSVSYNELADWRVGGGLDGSPAFCS